MNLVFEVWRIEDSVLVYIGQTMILCNEIDKECEPRLHHGRFISKLIRSREKVVLVIRK